MSYKVFRTPEDFVREIKTITFHAYPELTRVHVQFHQETIDEHTKYRLSVATYTGSGLKENETMWIRVSSVTTMGKLMKEFLSQLFKIEELIKIKVNRTIISNETENEE